MTRRFLTAEDVRRAAGNEIVVDAETVVTPQALEVARQAGITIRGAAGSYAEPQPDRGPDASRAVTKLRQIPEPEGALKGRGLIVTVVGCNRPGVLAEVSAAIAALGGNVNDISQKMVDQYFHMVFVVELSRDGNFGDVKRELEALGSDNDYAVSVMHERVFRFMHRV
jgi:ACT domain-containing protein